MENQKRFDHGKKNKLNKNKYYKDNTLIQLSIKKATSQPNDFIMKIKNDIKSLILITESTLLKAQQSEVGQKNK